MTRHVIAALLVAAACASRGPIPSPAPLQASRPAGITREQLNGAALELALPLHWRSDANGNGEIDPAELAEIWGLDPARPLAHWVRDGAFTPAFRQAWAAVWARAGAAPARASGAPVSGFDAARQAAITREVAQSYFSVLESDFRGEPAEDRELVRHVLRAAALVERLHARQLGTLGMDAQIQAGDGLSRLAFYVNQGPWCSAPATESDLDCTAVAPRYPRLSGMYPADLQADRGFCAALAADPRHEALMDPFTLVVRDDSGALAAVPYHRAWPEDMRAVAAELRAAAKAVESPSEAALKAYLAAAAQAFEDGSWQAADEAWARMNAENSRWYLRVAPDEVYWDPCSLKAGFQVSFARIDGRSLAWQRRLDPLRGDMEFALAAMAGPPYAVRSVSFHLPDFIDVVVNAGDARAPRGATVGQSLPNWGPVANEGRGRTVAMVNFYQDPESRAVLRQRAASIFCPATMARWSEDPDSEVLDTVLHEAAHNLGPAHEYAVGGRKAEQIFGGPAASMLEELKAQTSALWLGDWLAGKGVVERGLAERSHVRSVAWVCGQLSQGMYDAQGKLKPYPSLAAIQLGSFLRDGALAWRPDAPAANGTDRGCLDLDVGRWPEAVTKLETQVLSVKARGDAPAAAALVAAFVDGPWPQRDVRSLVTERWRRFPSATFLYSVRVDD